MAWGRQAGVAMAWGRQEAMATALGAVAWVWMPAAARWGRAPA